MEEAFQGTVVGLIFNGGGVLASDSRSTRRYLVRSKKVPKIFRIQKKIGAAVSGLGGDARRLIDAMKSESNLYQMRREKSISTQSLARLTSNIFHGSRMFPYIVSMILSGVDSDGPKLYFLDPAGGSLKEDKFASAGTGSSVAYGVLEQNFEDGMDSESASRLAAQSVQQAIERDAATGDGVVLVRIDDEGYEQLSDDEVNSYLN